MLETKVKKIHLIQQQQILGGKRTYFFSLVYSKPNESLALRREER